MLAGCVPISVVACFMLAFADSAISTLPDNRAYEMVSPIEKGGLSVLPNLAVADVGGERVIVDGGSKNALLSSGASWIADTRTPTGWSGVQIGPAPTAAADFFRQAEVSLNGVSEDFSSFAFQSVMPLDLRDTTGGMGEYIRTGPSGPFEWVTGPPAPALPVSEPGECEGGLEPVNCTTDRSAFAGASSDLHDIVWGQYHPLLAPPASLSGYPADTHEHGYEVYESVNGVDQLVGLVPAGSERECGPSHENCVVPPCGAAMGNEGGGAVNEFGETAAFGFAPVAGAVSRYGSQVIFTSPDPVPYKEATHGCAPPEIFLRESGTATIQVSASHKAGGDPSGSKEKVYAGSSEEGGHLNTAFFISKEEMTEDANTGGADEGIALYAYTLAAGLQPEKLVDLTPVNNTPGPSGVAEVVFLGASTDGKLVYFTAASVLTAEPNSHGLTAKPGESNLYLYDATTRRTTFIAHGAGLAPPHIGLQYDPNPPAGGRLTSELTPDGRHLVFTSSERLSEYNNVGPECSGHANNGEPIREPGPCGEVYLYTVADNSLACLSCNPSGAPPAGSARLPERFVETPLYPGLEPGTLPVPKAISDDGSRVFFSSPDQLTGEVPPPATTNGPSEPLAINWEFEPNVFEYEAGGVHLIAPAAVLLTTTSSGRDVFFDTLRQLVPQDRDGSPDVYDAREGGGFPVLAPSACSEGSCQGVPGSAPIFATPATATFSGPGNFSFPLRPVKCKKGRVLKHKRCVKRARGRHARKSSAKRRGAR
jgi:hypothetical protein